MKAVSLLALLIFSLGLSVKADDVHVVNKDLKYGTERGLFGFLNVHSSDKSWLEIKGKRFSNLAGFEPYYLDVPGSDYVFFIKKETPLFRADEDEKFSYHFYSLSRGDIVFHDDIRLLARSLGRKHDPKFHLSVKAVSPSVMVVTERQSSFFWSYRFDLKAHTVGQSFKKIR